jgi:phosphate transport system substrate-binding protein
MTPAWMPHLRVPPVLALLGLMSCNTSSFPGTPPALSGALRLTGSTTVFPLARAAADAFARAHPAVRFDIHQSSTGEGLQAFINGEADVADATRPPSAEELAAAEKKGKHLHLTVIAYDAVVVLTNATNPVSNITVRDLKDIFFTGRIVDWAQVQGVGGGSRSVRVYHTSATVSGTAQLFQHKVLGAEPALYVSGSKEIHRTPDVVTSVRADPDAIAYSPMKWVGPGVKVLRVAGVEPSESTCLDGTYPFCRKLFFVTDGPPAGLARDYISFVLGTTCQHTVVRAQGFIPIF